MYQTRVTWSLGGVVEASQVLRIPGKGEKTGQRDLQSTVSNKSSPDEVGTFIDKLLQKSSSVR